MPGVEGCGASTRGGFPIPSGIVGPRVIKIVTTISYVSS